jgi:antirestriction protein ArdC
MKKLELVMKAIKTNEPEETLSMLYLQNGLSPAKHFNPITNKQFHGKNIYTLEIEMILKGYTSCEWSTFAQYRSNESKVNKGEKGTGLILAVYNTVKNEKTGEKEEKLQFFKSYTVFNKEQTSKLSEKKEEVATAEPVQKNLFDKKYAVVA